MEKITIHPIPVSRSSSTVAQSSQLQPTQTAQQQQKRVEYTIKKIIFTSFYFLKHYNFMIKLQFSKIIYK